MLPLLALLGCTPEPESAPSPPSTAPTGHTGHTGQVTLPPTGETGTIDTTPASIDPDVFPYEPLRCTAGAGASFSWFRDGIPYTGAVETLVPGDTVPAGVVAAGETWTCEATIRTFTTSDSLTLPLAPHNVLLVIVDDLGLDHFSPSDRGGDAPPMPNLDRMAAEGMVFDSAFAYSVCSPTRSALLTGRYGRRTGLGDLIGTATEFELPSEEISIPEMLATTATPWASSAVGKWHLGWNVSGPEQPLLQGFDWFAGTRGNLNVDGGTGYRDWTKWTAVPGEAPTRVSMTRYATQDTTDDAIARAAAMPEPWFMWLAYNAPHHPVEPPPPELIPFTLTGTERPHEVFDAVVTSLDTEIGRLLNGMDPGLLSRTTIIFLSDNGTPRDMITAPFDKEEGKQTPYEGGIHVPMLVWGPLVAQPGSRSSALVSVLDVFPTVAALAGARLDGLTRPDGDPVVLDGTSLLRHLAEPTTPGRIDQLMEQTTGFGAEMVVDVDILHEQDYALLAFEDHEELFDKRTSPTDEGEDLIAAGPLTPEADAALTRMRARISEATAPLVYENGP